MRVWKGVEGGRHCLSYVEREKVYTLLSIKPFCHPAGLNLLLGGLRVWIKWMLTPGHVCPCVSSLVSAGWTRVTFQAELKIELVLFYLFLGWYCFDCIYFEKVHQRKKIYLNHIISSSKMNIYFDFSQKTRFVAVTMCRGTVRSTTVNLVSSICCSPRTLKCNRFKRRLAQWPFFRWAQTMLNVKRILWQWIKQP